MHAETSVRERPAIDDGSVGDPDRLERGRAALLASLGLPRAFFAGRTVLQIGGPAASALQYSLWGAAVTLVATDARLADQAERMFLRHRRTARIETTERLLSDPAALARFAFVACEEPLLYSPDPLRDLELLLGHVARDGVVLAAIPERHCWERRLLMRKVVRVLATGDDEARRCGRQWFSRHVEETARSRGLSFDSALDELLVRQSGRPVDLADACRVFASRGMTYLGSSPSLRALSAGRCEDAFDYLKHQGRYRALERAWQAFGSDGCAEAERLDPARFMSRVEIECAALAAIANRIAARDVDDALIARLRGDAGGSCIDGLVVLAARQ